MAGITTYVAVVQMTRRSQATSDAVPRIQAVVRPHDHVDVERATTWCGASRQWSDLATWP
jgi:hypothetical protein